MMIGYLAFYSFGALLFFSGIGACVLAHALKTHLIKPIAAAYAVAGAAIIYFVYTAGPVGLLKQWGML
jgi:hypothetical protein